MSNIVSLRQKVEEKGVIPNKDRQLKAQKMKLGEIPVLDFLCEYARRHEPTGTWAYDTFERLNQQFFGDRLTLPVIQWGLTPWGRFYGYYMPQWQKIILHPSLMVKGSKAWGPLNPATREKETNKLLGVKFAEHVLLHELMHHANYLDHGVYDSDLKDSHNSQAWVDEINRIAPLLGLNIKAHVCSQRRFKKTGEKGPGKPRLAPPDDSYIDYEFMYTFPHKLMPPGYYEKATDELLRQNFKM